MANPRLAFVPFAFLAAPALVLAQGVPQGPEFRVNTHTTLSQLLPSVASDAAGNFVVTWTSVNQDGSGYGVFGQRYDLTGTPLGGEFRVNTLTLAHQESPSVASDSNGSFVVVWASGNQDGSGYAIFGQRYANTGAPVGTEFQVNTYTTGAQTLPSVASDSAGNFVVTWTSNGQDGYGLGVFAQRYSSAGIPVGGEFGVNTYTTLGQGGPSVASDSAGNFVVVWQSYLQDGDGSGVFAQRYSSTGAPLGPEFRVNTHTTDSQGGPSVASDSTGNFVVAWQSATQDGSGTGVFAQRYASTGAPLGGEFRVNTFTAGTQNSPAVASDSAGNFVIAWQSFSQDGSGYGVFAQRYASTGAPLGGEFRVNTFTTSEQRGSTVASDAAGDFVVAWWSVGQDGGYAGVYAQRYSMIVPVELQTFGVE